ncbi:MAG: hypothetical protein IKG22_05040, partial [Atopobiaceae bacterium]|nr:hypothetical protein [Atopobiaceae bacterium]
MRKLLSFVVACSMVFGSVPAPALAEAVEEAEAIVQGEVTEEQPESQPGDEAPGQAPEETAPESEGDAVAVEEGEPQEDALTVQNATKPYQVVLEAWVDYGSGGRWSSNTYVSPMDQFRIRAVDSSEDAMNMNYYDWHNATDTITFVPYPDETATYREGHTGPFTVSLNADKSSMDGLFYEEDGLTLPLPPGEYAFIVTSEAGEYSSLENGGNKTITVDDSSSYIFNGFYQTDGAGSFTRESFSVKGSESGQELDLVDLDTRVDLRLAINTVSVLGENPVVGSVGIKNPILNMYKAKDGNTALTIEQLEQLSASGNMDAWPTAFTWNGDAVDQKPVWQRSTSTTGTNGTTWSLTPNVGQKTAVFAINGIRLGDRFGTETSTLQPGVYFPVLRLNIDGELYYFAYNPIEVGYLNDERVAPTITTQTLPSAMKGLSYATTLKARTGVPTDSDPGTFSWAVTTGELPTGLSLNASTGAVSGTLASDATTQTFTVTLTETVDGVPMTTSKQYTIEVRDAVTLGEITYTPTGIIYIEDQDGATMHLSVPVSADLTNTALNLSQSDVVFNVYQTARNSTTSSPVAPQGSPLLVEACYNKQAGTLEADVPIGYDTTIVNRIEVNLRLKDNNGEYVQMPKEGDVSGEGDWAIITAEVAEPNITIGSYVRFPALSFDDEEATDIPTSARLRLWPYAEGSTAIPDSATEYELGTAEYTGYAQAKLVPGDYVFVIDGETPIYDANGQPSGKTRIVDLVGSVTDATPIEGTNPRQYLLHVGPNDGTFSSPRVVGVTYTTKNMSAKIRHYLNVRFQNESGEYTDDYVADYEVRWYRRKGDTQDTDVLVATGNYVQFGPSPYDLYVEVVPTGRNTSFWKSSDRVLVEDDVAEPVVNVPRKQLFSGTFTLTCASGKTPVDNGSWGIIEVQTPLAAGGYSSYNLWPTKNDTNTVVISGLTSGSIITFTPRIELEAGPVSYEVPTTTTGNFTAELVAPLPHSLITFEGFQFTGVDGTTDAVDLNDGVTGVAVNRIEADGNGVDQRYPVPFYVADGTHIVLQPEKGYDDDWYIEHGREAAYEVTITRREANAPDRMGTTHPDVTMREVKTISLSPESTKATITMADPITSFGYVNVPFSNPAKKLCTLLLYDGEGKLVESGPAGTSAQLRTPFLPAGAYTLYAVDANYLSKNADDYQTVDKLTQSTLAGANAARATSTALTVEQGKATTASTFAFPTNTTGELVNRERSTVTVEHAYTDKLAITMHAVLTKGVTLGEGAHLEISTNQPSDVGGVYMN